MQVCISAYIQKIYSNITELKIKQDETQTPKNQTTKPNFSILSPT